MSDERRKRPSRPADASIRQIRPSADPKRPSEAQKKTSAGQRAPSAGQRTSGKNIKRGFLPNAALVVILALLIVAGIFLLGYYATTVKTIVVEGNSLLTDNQVINLAGLYTGRNIFVYDLGSAMRGIESDPYLKCTGIRRSLPNKLIITVSERKEFAALLLGSSDYCVIDRSGYVLDIGRSEDSVKGLLPIYGLSAMGIRVGMNIDADKGKLRPFTIMEIIESLGDRSGEILSIDVSNTSNVKLVARNGVTVMLGDSVNIPSKIERMFRALPKVDPEKADTAIIYVNSSGTTDLSYPTPAPSAEPSEEPSASPDGGETP